MTASYLTPLGWSHFQNFQGRAAFDVGNVLRSNKDELSVAHSLSNFDQNINNKLSCDRIQLRKENNHQGKKEYEKVPCTQQRLQTLRLTKTSNSSMTRNGVSSISPKARRRAIVLFRQATGKNQKCEQTMLDAQSNFIQIKTERLT
jgi:hypothetical protein